MKLTKTLVACSLLAASTGLSSMAMAESPLTSNVGFTSNYIWRGATQGADEAAISGGIDYAHKSGAYAGVWTSSLGGGGSYELDLYAGYGFEAAGSQVHGCIFLNHGEPAQAGADDQGGHGGNPCELPQDNDR